MSSQVQQRNVTEFCQRYTDRTSASTKRTPGLLNHLYPKTLIDHLWFDDPKKVLFCAVPKIGSSTMNRHFLVINGYKTSDELGPKRPPPKVLALVNKLRNLNETKQISRLESYYSFTIVRNPLERLVSGYKDKLEHESSFWYQKLQHRILDLFRHDEFKAWESKNKSYELRPSFHEFIQYFISTPLVRLDHHFRPFTDVCFPCTLKYDFYVSFKSFDNDIKVLFHHLGLPFDNHPRRTSRQIHPTSQFVAKYFNQLPTELKKRLKEKLDHDLKFYYLFHPEDKANDSELLLG